MCSNNNIHNIVMYTKKIEIKRGLVNGLMSFSKDYNKTALNKIQDFV